MAVYGINYNEGGKPDLAYEGIYLWETYPEKKETLFNSGDFVKDWYYLTKHVINNTHEDERVMGSSSVDHFFMDGADELYDEAYLHDDGNGYDLHYDTLTNRIRFYVPKGTKPTWNELRELCGDKKQNDKS